MSDPCANCGKPKSDCKVERCPLYACREGEGGRQVNKPELACDNGCKDCEKNPVFMLHTELGIFPCRTIDVVLRYIKADVECLDEDDEPLEFKITVGRMSQH